MKYVTLNRLLAVVVFVLGLAGFILSLEGILQLWNFAFTSTSDRDFLSSLLKQAVKSPLAGLFSGLVITSIIQSSSTAVALIIAAVASGALPPDQTVYLIIGCNIATTVTQALIASSYSLNREEFKQTAPAAFVDHLYKVSYCSLFVVIEYFTGFLSLISRWLSEVFNPAGLDNSLLEVGIGTEFLDSIVKAYFGIVTTKVEYATLQGIILTASVFLCLQISIRTISWVIQRELDLLHINFEEKFAKDKRPISFLLSGFGLCWLLQSSTLTLSLILPFSAKKLIKLKQVLYFAAGAALATTCDPTQLMSYFKFGTSGISIGLIHILLNLFGIVFLITFPKVEDFIISTAQKIAQVFTGSNWGGLYLAGSIVVVFYVLPLALIFYF